METIQKGKRNNIIPLYRMLLLLCFVIILLQLFKILDKGNKLNIGYHHIGFLLIICTSILLSNVLSEQYNKNHMIGITIPFLFIIIPLCIIHWNTQLIVQSHKFDVAYLFQLISYFVSILYFSKHKNNERILSNSIIISNIFVFIFMFISIIMIRKTYIENVIQRTDD